MIPGRLFNNIGMEAMSIAFVLKHQQEMKLSKVLLISPITTHNKLILHLARKNTAILSFEKYFIENFSNFANFNDRYYDGLVSSLNAVQLLNELEIVEVKGATVNLINEISYESSMGKRAEKIWKAAHNISSLLNESSEKLYLNLRIQL